jgi:hypothetical protein
MAERFAAINGEIALLFPWMNKHKPTPHRCDSCFKRFAAFVHLAFSMILMRRLLQFMRRVLENGTYNRGTVDVLCQLCLTLLP